MPIAAAAFRVLAVAGVRSGLPVGAVTVSIGVSLASPDEPDTRALVNRADAALYDAKRSGRNTVVFKPVSDA